jgi:hypothetical protein
MRPLRLAAMVTSIGAMVKRSNVLRKAAARSSLEGPLRGPSRPASPCALTRYPRCPGHLGDILGRAKP